jgi:hypothetical protein
MGRNLIVREGFPLREEEARDSRRLHKKLDIFKKNLCILQVRSND